MIKGAEWQPVGAGPSAGFLRLKEITSNPRIECWNRDDNHTDNFYAVGARKIEVDLNASTSPNQLVVRVGIEGGNATQWVTNNVFAVTGVPASPNWSRYQFLLFESQMTRVSGTDSLNTALGSVSEVRIFHAPSPAQWLGSSSGGVTLGIDNVTLPEPGGVSGCAAGAALLALLAGRPRRS